jgi:5'-deoxynucleotidase YfbR-like HD superfamily hydrolase
MSQKVERPHDWFFKGEIGNLSLESSLWFRAMSGIPRYQGVEMVHRWSVFDHVRRVGKDTGQLLGHIILELKDPTLQPDLFIILREGYHHDDEEPVVTDYLTPVKRAWSNEEKQRQEELASQAQVAVADLVLGLSPAEKEEYLQDREELRAESSLEAQIVKAADKLDAYGEKLHNLRCGNWEAVKMMELSHQIIGELDRFPWWERIKNHYLLRLGEFPSITEYLLMGPKLSSADFRSREELEQVLFSDTEDPKQGMPNFYFTWLRAGWNSLEDKDREKMLLPGWANNLYQRWGYPKDMKSTPSGLWLPGRF